MRAAVPDKRLHYICKLFGIADRSILDVHSSAPTQQRMAQLNSAEGQFLQFLVYTTKIKTVVELGTCAGFSSICIAKSLPPTGHVYTIERQETNVIKARENITKCGMQEKITVLHGDAIEQLKNLESTAPFDMIFIDANKSGYCSYLDWAELHVRKGGLIVADNVFLFGTVFDDKPSGNISSSTHKNMQTFNLRLANKDKYLASIIQTEEGLLVAVKLT